MSLDIDFEQGFTEPAPIDAIVQRLGRINRYAAWSKRRPAYARIFTKQLSKDNKVYPEELRNKSIQVLSSLGNPLGEGMLNDAADAVYGSGYDHDNQTKYDEGLNCIQVNNMVAGTNRDWVEDLIDDNEGSIEMLPEQFRDDYRDKRKDGLIIEAYGLCIPVGRWQLPYL